MKKMLLEAKNSRLAWGQCDLAAPGSSRTRVSGGERKQINMSGRGPTLSMGGPTTAVPHYRRQHHSRGGAFRPLRDSPTGVDNRILARPISTRLGASQCWQHIPHRHHTQSGRVPWVMARANCGEAIVKQHCGKLGSGACFPLLSFNEARQSIRLWDVRCATFLNPKYTIRRGACLAGRVQSNVVWVMRLDTHSGWL